MSLAFERPQSELKVLFRYLHEKLQEPHNTPVTFHVAVHQVLQMATVCRNYLICCPFFQRAKIDKIVKLPKLIIKPVCETKNQDSILVLLVKN